MNIKGASRAGGRELANHLLNAEKNETVKIFAVESTVSQNLYGAFQEMEAVSSGTRCKKPLYHLKISPDPKEPALTPEQWQRSIDALKDQFGLKDHAYAAVLHRKYGAAHPEILREHLHVVFCRINPDTMLAMHAGHNYRQHELVSRQLEKEFGHARIQGAHIGREGADRPQRTPPDWMMQQAAKSGVQPRDVAATVKQLWKESDSAKSFAASLAWEGFTLAVGRRDLVVLDRTGDVHTLARCLDTKVAEIRDRMAGIDRSKLPSVEQAREAIRERSAEREKHGAVWDRDGADATWQDAVINAAIDKEKTERRFVEPKPEAGTLPGPITAPAVDGQRAEVRALAARLQKQTDRQEGHAPADDEALKERLAAFGFDTAKAATLVKWRELGSEVDGGRITEKDRLREMGEYIWHQADKERRDAQIPDAPARRREHDRDR